MSSQSMRGGWHSYRRVLEACRQAAVLEELSGGTILGVNRRALTLFGATSADLEGRLLRDVVALPGGEELREAVAGGALRMYEAEATVRFSGQPVVVSMRALQRGNPRVAIVMLRPGGTAHTHDHIEMPTGRVVAIGSTDEDLVIDHVHGSLIPVMGRAPSELVGESILDIVKPSEISTVIGLGLQQTIAASPDDEVIVVEMDTATEVPHSLVLSHRADDAGFAFVVVEADDTQHPAHHGTGSTDVTLPVEPVLNESEQYQEQSKRLSLLAKLAPREKEVVIELLAGYRPPSISARLFLSVGTVRNHLSTAYHKLGVKDQQELIDLFRNRGPSTITSTSIPRQGQPRSPR